MNTWNDVRNFMDSGEPLDPVPTGMELVPVVGLTFVKDYPGNVLRLQRLQYAEVDVVLVRNPQNQYDHNAIEVHVDGQMLGHVPKETAARLAPQVDGGADLQAYLFGIRVSPENPLHPGVDLVVGLKP